MTKSLARKQLSSVKNKLFARGVGSYGGGDGRRRAVVFTSAVRLLTHEVLSVSRYAGTILLPKGGVLYEQPAFIGHNSVYFVFTDSPAGGPSRYYFK